MDKESSGILFCAIGVENFTRAKISIESIKKHNSSLKVAIYTEQDELFNKCDIVIKAHAYKNISFKNEMVFKLDAILESPFEKTLYLDADTYVMDDISDIFKLCNLFELSFCHGHNRYKRFNLIQNEPNSLLNKKIPYSFAPLQGGLLLFNTKQTKYFFQTVKKQYLSKGYFDDQAIIRELLWESELRFYVMPPEYNFNSLDVIKKWKINPVEAKPKIFHYTQHKKYDIEKLVSKALKKQYLLKRFLLKLGLFIKDIRKL